MVCAAPIALPVVRSRLRLHPAYQFQFPSQRPSVPVTTSSAGMWHRAAWRLARKRQLTSQTDANDNRTELEYDDYGRLWKRFYPSPSGAGAVNYSDYNEYT